MLCMRFYYLISTCEAEGGGMTLCKIDNGS
eukprot:COSAG06_NODE_1061_length_10874_cov_7.752390_8_plen_30_part_00